MDRGFRERAERVTAQKVEALRKELSWEQEKNRLGLRKLLTRFRHILQGKIR